MIIKSKNFVLKLEEILKDDLPSERYNELENFVLKIVREWYSPAKYFEHNTSGSTGRPKKIKISREKIEISTQATMAFIDPENKIKSSLLCLDPRHIGGAMVVYRSLICEHDITILEPNLFPSNIANDNFDIVSLVPIQFRKLNEEELDRFRTILIGGAPIEVQSVKSKAKIYSTFGMTETVSHIALRSIDDPIFKTTGDVEVSVNKDETLQIKGSITGNEWLTTNDIVDIKSPNSFQWIGRKDFIINTGGVKVNPEEVENLLERVIPEEFIISSIPDKRLNQKVVLISSGPKREIDFSFLEKYHRPKVSYFDLPIYKTASGKIDRIKTQKQLEKIA